jgi:hypothetical protein
MTFEEKIAALETEPRPRSQDVTIRISVLKPEYPKRDVLLWQGKELEVLVLEKRDGQTIVQIDDERAGEQNGLQLSISVTQ